MSREIRILDGDGEGRYRVLFLFPVATPKTYTNADREAVRVAPTPAPTEGLVASLLSAEERAALDAGSAVYSVVNYGPAATRTAGQHGTQLRAMYVRERERVTAWYEAKYRHIGTTFDAE